MDFISHNIKSENFPNLNLELKKKYPDITVTISIVKRKNYPYLSFCQNILLHKNVKSSRKISIFPAGIVFKVGTSFRIDKSLEQKGINAKSTYCRNETKSMPIVLKNSRESKKN